VEAMKNDAEIVKTGQDTGHHRKRATKKPAPRLEKSAPAEKTVYIPLPFDTVMGAVLSIKPQSKAKTKPSKQSVWVTP